mgnify:CR=1 FL=1|jgi:hypothetical protein
MLLSVVYTINSTMPYLIKLDKWQVLFKYKYKYKYKHKNKHKESRVLLSIAKQ